MYVCYGIADFSLENIVRGENSDSSDSILLTNFTARVLETFATNDSLIN